MVPEATARTAAPGTSGREASKAALITCNLWKLSAAISFTSKITTQPISSALSLVLHLKYGDLGTVFALIR